MQNLSYENDFDLHENETARRTHFHMNGFSLRLDLKQRHKRIGNCLLSFVKQEIKALKTVLRHS